VSFGLLRNPSSRLLQEALFTQHFKVVKANTIADLLSVCLCLISRRWILLQSSYLGYSNLHLNAVINFWFKFANLLAVFMMKVAQQWRWCWWWWTIVSQLLCKQSYNFWYQ